MVTLTYVGITNPSSTQKCTAGNVADPSLPPTRTAGTETNNTGYTNISTSNGVRLNQGSTAACPYEIFSAVVPAACSRLKWYWEGRFANVQTGQTFGDSGKIFIWKTTTSTWEQIGSYSNPGDKNPPDGTVTITKTTTAANYIDGSNKIFMLALQDGVGEAGNTESTQTDYVYFEYDAAAGKSQQVMIL